jgi:hypothetical protein
MTCYILKYTCAQLVLVMVLVLLFASFAYFSGARGGMEASTSIQIQAMNLLSTRSARFVFGALNCLRGLSEY